MKQRFIALLLAIMLVLSSSVTALADNRNAMPGGAAGSITVGTQVGEVTYGTEATSIYTLTIGNVTGSDWSIQWYKAGTPTDAVPASFSVSGSTLALMYDGHQDAGNYTFTLSCDGVTGNEAVYVIKQKAASITSGSTAKVYDGTPLTCETYKVSGFVEGDGVKVSCSGSQTDAGTSPNTFSYRAKTGTDLSNYIITENFGTLLVTNDSFAVTGEDYNELYDGTVHMFSVKVTGKNGQDLTTASGMTIEYNTSPDGSSWNGWTGDAPAVKDAGTLYVKAKATCNSVTVDSFVYKLTVMRRNIILTSRSAEKEYDGTALVSPAVEQSGDGFAGSEGFQNAPTAVGSIVKTGSVPNDISNFTLTDNTNAANYSFVKKPGMLTIRPKSEAIIITTPSAQKVYDGSAIGTGTPAWTDGVLLPGHTLTVTLSRTGDDAVKDAGSYENDIKSYMVADGQGEDVTDCYTFGTPVPGTLTIEKRKLTLTSGSDIKLFIQAGDKAYNDQVNLSGEGLAGEETLSYSGFKAVSAVSTKPAANTFEYAAAAGSAFKEDNYDITKVYGNLMLAGETTIAGMDRTFKYDGKSHEAPVTLIDNGQGAEVKIEYSTSTDNKTWTSYTQTVPAIKDAGTLYVKAKATKGAQVMEAAYKITVEPREVKIISSSATKEYDGKELKDSNYRISQDGFVNGEGVIVTVTGTRTYAGSSANTFEYKYPSGTKEGNYIISSEYGVLTVRKNSSVVTIVSGSDSWTYNGMTLRCSEYEVSWKGQTITDGRLFDKDVLIIAPVASITDVGTTENRFSYRVISNGNADVTDCYSFDCESGELEVTPRSVVITTESAEKVYDGTALTGNRYTVTGDGFISGEGFESVNVVGSRTNAGSVQNELDETTPYIFKAGTNKANYQVSVAEGTLTVNKRKVVVTSGSAISKYGDCPADGLKNTAQCAVSGDGFVSGDIQSGYPKGDGVLAKPATEPSESDPAYVMNTIAYGWTGNGNPANYEITESLGYLVVSDNSSALTVVVDYTGVYDGKSHGGSVVTDMKGATISYSTDGKDHFDPSKEWSTTAPTAKDVSTTKVDIMVKDGSNYAFGSYTITITRRILTITAGSAEKVYDGTALKCSDYTIGGDGYAGDENAEIVIGTMSGQDPVNVGTDENVVLAVNDQNGFKGTNYSIEAIAGTLEIKKRPVVLISKDLGVTPEDKVLYDGQAHSRSGDDAIVEVGNTARGGRKDISGMGFVGTDGLDFDDFPEVTDAGLYSNSFTYSGKAGTDLDNYEIETVFGVLNISRREIKLTSGSASKVYDGNPLTCAKVTVRGDGFIAGEGIDLEYLGSRTDVGKSANTFRYEFRQGTKSMNYYIPEENLTAGTLEVYEAVVNTGVNFNPELWIMLAAVSAAALLGMFIVMRKRCCKTV